VKDAGTFGPLREPGRAMRDGNGRPMTEERNPAGRRRMRGMRPAQIAAAAAWGAAIAGFAVYLVMGAFKDAYGSVGTGVVLLLWMTLFSVLYYVTPDMRPPRPSPVRPRSLSMVDRVVIPSAALRNSTAQGRMMSVLGPRAVGLSDHEVDLMDWGFAFGVAWAVARHQDPVAAEEIVSRRALHATQAVYEAYRGTRAPGIGPGPGGEPNESNGGPSAANPHANGSGPSDTADLRT
jgi:hypothetical protein